MRTVALLIVIMAGIFLLLTDKKLTFGGGGKGNKSQNSSSPSSSGSGNTMDSLSDEYKPQDLSKYSNINKLNEDFEYRRTKLEYNQDEEIKEFLKTHDRYGKDKEEYDKLTKQQAALRKEFQDNRVKTLQYYQDTKSTDGPINTDLR